MKNIFVGNLSFGATEDGVRSMFQAYGTVERVNLITDRDTGRAKGFGFVEINSGSRKSRMEKATCSERRRLSKKSTCLLSARNHHDPYRQR